MKKISTSCMILIMLLIFTINGFARPTDNPGLKIQYTFNNVTGNTVPNAAPGETDYNGTICNDASVIQMGKYNVLSLGTIAGYLDMGQSIGNVFQTMGDYTVSAYYRVGTNASLSGAGFFLWEFCTSNANTQTLGVYSAYRLNAQRFALSTGGWGSENGIEVGQAADKGGWHNVVYRQTGNSGEIYIDGQLAVSSDELATPISIPTPSSAFYTPPIYNWIGKSPFVGDSYLLNTLVYDFRLYDLAVPDQQINDWATVIPDLDNEYYNNAINDLNDLLDEAEALLGEWNDNLYPRAAMMALDAAYTNVDNAYSSITAANIETYVDMLRTAVESYKASALGLKIQYKFDNVTGNTVTNTAPGATGYNGTIYNNASVIQMGNYNVLSLGNGTGYLDMGQSAGYIFPTIDNYTVSVYYRIDKNASLIGDGYFLWSFSTSNACGWNVGAYAAYRLNAQSLMLTPSGYTSESNITLGIAADKDGWHNLVYRQTGKTGTLYIDGNQVGDPNDALPLPTDIFPIPPAYNWIGKSPFTGDNYLKNTLIYDFELYNQAVPLQQIADWAAALPDLENAYEYGSVGDFSQLAALIAQYNAVVANTTIGDGVGQYTQDVVDSFKIAIGVAQSVIDDNKDSQFLIDDEVTILTAAYRTFLGSVGAVAVYPALAGESPYNFESGLYYIQIGDYYLTVPETGVKDTYLQLRSYIDNPDKLHNNQVWNIQYNTIYSYLESDPPMPLYSLVSDKTVWDTDGAWHLDEICRMKDGDTPTAQSSDNTNWSWRCHQIFFNGTAYCITGNQNGDGTVSNALIFPNETLNEQATNASPTQKVFNVFFRTIDDVVANPATPDAIQMPKVANNVKIYGSLGEIAVSGINAGDRISVYDISGRLVKTLKASGVESRFNVVRGLYIVKVSGQTPAVGKALVQ